ncbi:MAG: glutaredoxin 3 [Acidiferrobacterales bacterium]|nr:glutaredoxin 3 [Acidiferrobacterales bacterium]
MKNVTIYTKDYCPYCKAAKQILTARGLDFIEHDVQFDQAKLQEMIERSGRLTVPQIFFDDEHIGGHSDLVSFFSDRRVA